jgi:hypothetical protein
MPLFAGDKLGPNEFKTPVLRFQTRPENRGLRMGTSLCLLVSLSLRLIFPPSHHAASRWIAGLQFLATLLLVFSGLLLVLSRWPSYCEFQETALILRLGWRKKFSMPYGSLAEIKPVSGRIVIAATDGKRFAIPVVEPARFLREAYRQCPQLKAG